MQTRSTTVLSLEYEGKGFEVRTPELELMDALAPPTPTISLKNLVLIEFRTTFFELDAVCVVLKFKGETWLQDGLRRLSQLQLQRRINK